MPGKMLASLALACALWVPTVISQASSSSLGAPVTTTALPGSDTPKNHWKPDRPDPYVCEYLGENDCWQPTVVQEGPPYSGFVEGERAPRTKTCKVKAGNDPSVDDAPAICQAFSECRENANIIFENTTYHIQTVMNTTGLSNVDVNVQGSLLWDASDLNYWLNVSSNE